VSYGFGKSEKNWKKGATEVTGRKKEMEVQHTVSELDTKREKKEEGVLLVAKPEVGDLKKTKLVPEGTIRRWGRRQLPETTGGGRRTGKCLGVGKPGGQFKTRPSTMARKIF